MKPLTAIKTTVVAGLGLICAWSAAANTLGNASRTHAPAIAVRIAPGDGRVLANYAQMQVMRAQTLQAQGKSAPFPAIADTARQALRAEPLNSIALRLLGLDAENRKNGAAAARLLDLSQRVSRRDGGTQLWLILAYSRQADVVQIIRHCDILLRTQPDAMPALAPVLNQAMESPDFRSAMQPYLRRSSPWIPDYLNFAAGNARNPAAVSMTVRMAGGVPESKVRQETESVLLRRLLDANSADEALKFFPLMKGAQPGIARRADFSTTTADPRYVPVSWEALSPDAMVATFDRENDGKLSLNAVASSGERGVVARKLLTLAPGKYRFLQNVTLATAGDRNASAIWKLNCLSSKGSNELWRTAGTWREPGKYLLDGPAISAACPIQMLELELAGGLAGEGAELSIASVGLQRVGEPGNSDRPGSAKGAQ